LGGGGGGAVGTTLGGAGYNSGSAGGGGSAGSWANTPGGNAGANTGGGGGGGSHYNANNKGGDGGSGIVVIRHNAVTSEVSFINTAADDLFASQSGVFIANAQAASNLSYQIVGGIHSSESSTILGRFGRLTVDLDSGAYSYVPNQSAINLLSTDFVENYTIYVSDGSNIADAIRYIVNIDTAGTSQIGIPDINLVDSTISSVTLPIEITSTNFNYTYDPQASKLYLNNTLVSHNYGRGHTLFVIDSTGSIESRSTFDTYGVGTSGLVNAINGVPTGKTIALVSWDATSCDAALNSALSPFGSSNTITWGSSRMSHAFVGYRGLTAGQAFEQHSSSNLTMTASSNTGNSVTAEISLAFTDIDLVDVGHNLTVTNLAVDGAKNGVTQALSTSDINTLKSWISSATSKENGSISGLTQLKFSAPASALDYLKVGEVLTLTYTVAVNDGDGGVD
ncbi:MAG: hypothetical protein EBR60_11220, partial [Burkholderiaceae bacterium]|nr:hypothetical protein [Burkholderiaceae bacterium]